MPDRPDGALSGGEMPPRSKSLTPNVNMKPNLTERLGLEVLARREVVRNPLLDDAENRDLLRHNPSYA